METKVRTVGNLQCFLSYWPSIFEIWTVSNTPFPSSLLPLCQNESSCETILMKMCSAFRLIVMQMRLIFMIGFARGLVLKQRQKQTRNSPIAIV